MSRTLPLLATLCLSAAVLLAAAEPPKQAANPVIHADVPDMAMVRVGDTYYMSSTTMHMSPGLPIMKSKDLVNWRLVSYAYDVLDDVDALKLENGKNAYGRGSWASSLRYHDGMFYATTFSGTTARHTSTRRRTSRRARGRPRPSPPRCTTTRCSSTTTAASTCCMAAATSGWPS